MMIATPLLSPRVMIDDTVARLEELIMRGELAPGARLREQQLADTLGVSRGPLREAIRTLEGRRLLERTPHAGVRVVQLSLDDLEQLLAMREALEGMAKAIAAQPWQWPLPLMVSDGVPCRSDDSWFLQTDAGDRLPLSITDNDGWELLTQGGGRPLSVWGEWDGARFQPLSAWEPGTSGSPLWREGARP